MLGNEMLKGQNVRIQKLLLRHQENVLLLKYWKHRHNESAGNTKMHIFEWPKIHIKRIYLLSRYYVH